MSAQKMSTELQLKKVKPTEKDQWAMVSNICTGLYLRITTKGAKSFYYRFTINGKQRKLFIGTSPAMSLKEAQRQHVTFYNQVRAGIDIVQVRQVEKAKAAAIVVGLTVDQLFDRFMSEHGAKLAINTRNGHEKRWGKWVSPVIGKLKAQLVQPRHIINIRDSVLNEGKSATARAVVALINQMYGFANSELLVDAHNPAQYIKCDHRVKVGIAWNDDEIKVILQSLDEDRCYGMSFVVQQAGKLLIYSGQRRTQIVSTEIEWFTFADDGLTCACEYPARVMKMKKPFIVFFGQEATQIIKDTIRYNGKSKYLFPSTFKGYGHLGPDHLTQGFSTLLKAKGLNGVLHSARHTFLSGTIRIGCDPTIADSCLAHTNKSSAVAAVYTHSQPYEKQKQVWQAWENHLKAFMNGEVDTDVGNVLKLFG